MSDQVLDDFLVGIVWLSVLTLDIVIWISNGVIVLLFTTVFWRRLLSVNEQNDNVIIAKLMHFTHD